MLDSHKCPKCGSEMQEGFIVEHRQPVRWIAGPPEKSILGGFKGGGENREIKTYLCPGCYYLESYAPKRIG